MKPRPWQVRRQQIEMASAAPRWDQAYQALLIWTLPPPLYPPTDPALNRDAQEATDAHCPLCSSFDPTSSPEPGT
jgi:hypothetical protein